MANLLSVNIGAAARLPVPGGRTVLSAIRKTPVEAPVVVGPLGLAGDEQADLSVHGGLQKAVYAYPVEHLAFWRAERARQGVVTADQPLPPGFMGENLTLTGLVEREAWIGDLLRFEGSDCVLRVTGPREPCGKGRAGCRCWTPCVPSGPSTATDGNGVVRCAVLCVKVDAIGTDTA